MEREGLEARLEGSGAHALCNVLAEGRGPGDGRESIELGFARDTVPAECSDVVVCSSKRSSPDHLPDPLSDGDSVRPFLGVARDRLNPGGVGDVEQVQIDCH
jgi:hypothetical protein